MLIRGETTEERIAKIAQGFGQGFQNFQQGQDRQRAQSLQDEALKRQQALQAFEVSNSFAAQTGKYIDPGQVAPLISSGSLGGIGELMKSAPMTQKAEREVADRQRQIEMQEIDKQYKQARNNELSKPFEETTKGKQAKMKASYEAVDNIRKEITSLPATKSLVEIDTALAKINSAPETAAGDITRVFSFMKLNDPNSTVREGEYATAQNAAGVPERIRAAYNQSLTGQVLTPAQRKDFENSALSLAKSQYETFKSYTEPQRKRIAELGLDSSQIFPTFSQQALYESQATTQPQYPALGRITDRAGVANTPAVNPQILKKVQSYTPEQIEARKAELRRKDVANANR